MKIDMQVDLCVKKNLAINLRTILLLINHTGKITIGLITIRLGLLTYVVTRY